MSIRKQSKTKIDKPATGFKQEYRIYKCDNCSNCRNKILCTKAKENRQISFYKKSVE